MPDFRTSPKPNQEGLIDDSPMLSEEQDKLPRIRFSDENERSFGDKPEGMISPHRHHVLDVNGRPGEHRAIVREGQDILRSYDIDPLQGNENLVWAPNKGHTKAATQNLVDDLRNAKEIGLNRDSIVKILKTHGQKAVKR